MTTPRELIPDSTAPREAVERVIGLMQSDGFLASIEPYIEDLRAVFDELHEPLRVAVVGKTNAGKSTLINSLVGASVAPTDALSCTKFVAWYQKDHYDWAQIRLLPTPMDRESDVDDHEYRTITWPPPEGARIAEDVEDERIDDIHVWRQGLPRLCKWTVIDTPGYNDHDDVVRERTRRVFARKSIDAVIFVLNGAVAEEEFEFFSGVRTDLAAAMFPEAVTESRVLPGHFGVVNSLAVLSRIDMADKQDPFGGAKKVIDQYAGELRGIASTVIPVLGLLAEAANQLTDQDYDALTRLRDLAQYELMPPIFGTAAARAGLGSDLVERIPKILGTYGLGFALSQIREGQVSSSIELSKALLEHSRLGDLDQELQQRFTDRMEALKARTAVRTLRRLIQQRGEPADRTRLKQYLDRVMQLEGMQTVREFEAFERWQSGEVPLPDHIGRALKALAFGQDLGSRACIKSTASRAELREALLELIRDCDDVYQEGWPKRTKDIVWIMRSSYQSMLANLKAGARR